MKPKIKAAFEALQKKMDEKLETVRQENAEARQAQGGDYMSFDEVEDAETAIDQRVARLAQEDVEE